MMFIVRTSAGSVPPFEVKMVRRAPDTSGRTDYFCLGDPGSAQDVVMVHDGWYADDTGGGVAIWGQGMFWEVRDTPLSVREACGPEAWPATVAHDRDAVVNVRAAIFRG